MKKLFILLLSVLLLLPAQVFAADSFEDTARNIYTVHDENGEVLFRWAGAVFEADEYITADNKRYRISVVDDDAFHASAVYVEDVMLADTAFAPLPAAAGTPAVAIYCTHSDESYINGDGTESEADGGGILDVARELGRTLEQMGFAVQVDTSDHTPHDEGAYRRSRKTATALLQQHAPDLLLDVHRDGIPDAAEYEISFNGVDVSRIRLVVGRSNENREANEKLAHRLKAAADAVYPGLVRDIFIGKGSYNQDISEQSILLEVGTHTIDKDRVMATTALVGEVIGMALDQTSAAPSPTGSTAPQGNGNVGGATAKPQATAPASLPQGDGLGPGFWVALALLVLGFLGLAGYLIYQNRNSTPPS